MVLKSGDRTDRDREVLYLEKLGLGGVGKELQLTPEEAKTQVLGCRCQTSPCPLRQAVLTLAAPPRVCFYPRRA